MVERKIPLTTEELESFHCGEAMTLAAVMAVLVIAIVTVVVYKLYSSGDGLVTLPGGYKFQWK